LMRKRSNLQRVQYLVVDNQLVRRYWLSLDQGIGEKPIQAVLLNQVESVEFEFIDAENRPIQTWPLQTSGQSAKPLVLSMRLDLTDIGEITRLLEIPDGAL
jgi:general secretion pathway protein J